MKRPPHMFLKDGLPSGVHESDREVQALTRLSEEDRQFIIDKLAEMLVLDYQENQTVTRRTIKVPSLSHRKSGMASRRTP